MKKLPKSIRKYIRKEKARIRREVLDLAEQKRLIDELYKKFLKQKPAPSASGAAESNKARGCLEN